MTTKIVDGEKYYTKQEKALEEKGDILYKYGTSLFGKVSSVKDLIAITKKSTKPMFSEVCDINVKLMADIENYTCNHKTIINQFIKFLAFCLDKVGTQFDKNCCTFLIDDSGKKSMHFIYNSGICFKYNGKKSGPNSINSQWEFWNFAKGILQDNAEKYPDLSSWTLNIQGKKNYISEIHSIDFAVYSKNRAMRMPGSYKTKNDNRVFVPASLNGNLLDEDLSEKYLINDYSPEPSFYSFNYPDETDYTRVRRARANMKKCDNTNQVKAVRRTFRKSIDDIQDIIMKKLDDIEIDEIDKNLIKLRNTGPRVCLASGLIDEEDNAYVVVGRDGLYFHCHDLLHMEDHPGGIKFHSWSREEKVKIVENNDYSNTDENMARLFTKYYGEDFIYVYSDDEGKHGNFYFFNGILWNNDRNNRIISTMICNDLYFKLDGIINDKIAEADNDTRKVLMHIKASFRVLQSHNKITNILKRLQHHLWKDVELDVDPNILVFANGCYDFKIWGLRNSERDEYVTDTLSCGYDYKEEFIDDTDIFRLKYMDKILINKADDKKVFLRLLSTCLFGQRIKKFIIANGSGDNGKSNLMALISNMLGSYALKINVKEICQGKKDTFMLNNLHNKRFVYCEEPDSETQKFDGNFIKDLTGGDKACFRKIYGASGDINIKSLLITCCNARPQIAPCDDAVKIRLMDYPFLSTFTNDDINDVDRFEGNEYYDTEEFRKDNSLNLFHYLIPYLKDFLKFKKIILTKNLEARRDEYLVQSDEFYCWWLDNYEITDSKEDILTITQIFKNFKCDEYYINLSRKDKRSMTKSKFREKLLSKRVIKKQYRDRYQPVINGKQKQMRECLIGIKMKEEEDEEDEEDGVKYEEDEEYLI